MRSSGILLHITSLPGRYPVSDFDPEVYRFVDWLASAGQTYWQILPLNAVEGVYFSSPHSICSAFAENIWMMSPNC